MLLVLFSPTGIAACALRGHIAGSMKMHGIAPGNDPASLCNATRFRVCERPEESVGETDGAVSDESTKSCQTCHERRMRRLDCLYSERPAQDMHGE